MTQIGLFDDFAKEKIFGPGKEGIAKVFMEGGGLPWEEKFKNPVLSFLKSYSFMSFNDLPPCLEPLGPPNETKKQRNGRVPFVMRCTYHETTKTYDSANDEFPYNAPQLAMWLQEMMKKRSP